MQAPFFDYAPTATWYRQFEHSKHKEKLVEIRSKSSKTLDHSEPVALKSSPLGKSKKPARRSSKLLQTSHDHLHKSRLQEIAVHTNRFPAKKPIKISLNYESRKREAKRISEDNEAFSKRLSKVQSTINKKLLDKDYGIATKYGKISSKKKQLVSSKAKAVC